MNILQIIPYFTPKRGGDVNVCYNISKQLRTCGNNVTILTTDFEFDPNYAKIAENLGIKVISFPCILNMKLFLYSPDMKQWLDSNICNFDIVHLHDFRSYQNIICCNAAKKYSKPYILQPHGSTPRIIEKKRLKLLYDIFYGYKIFKNASHVIAVSEEEANYDKKMGLKENKISVIYNGLELDFVAKSHTLGNFKKKYDINGKMILYLGRIHKTKGIDFAIRAFSELVKEMDNVLFVIAGSDNDYKKELESIINKLGISDKVIFTGFIGESDKIDAYSDADIFIHTVKYMGGVGLAPLEAILCGTPVIVTDECAEIIKKSNSGYIVNYDDLVSLKDTMKYILEHQEEVKINASTYKKYILENYSWEKVTKEYLKLYSNVKERSLA